MNMPNCHIASDVHDLYPAQRFALIGAGGVFFAALSKRLQDDAASWITTLRAGEIELRDRMEHFEELFKEFGARSPLNSQLDHTLAKGLPAGNPAVAALLFCEMSTGVLMGVQDMAAVDGDLVFSLAEEGETFAGFRDSITCSFGEPVLRDKAGIIASLIQGPDRRTQITKQTTDLLFYVFDAPGLPGAAFRGAIATVTALLGPPVSKELIGNTYPPNVEV